MLRRVRCCNQEGAVFVTTVWFPRAPDVFLDRRGRAGGKKRLRDEGVSGRTLDQRTPSQCRYHGNQNGDAEEGSTRPLMSRPGPSCLVQAPDVSSRPLMLSHPPVLEMQHI
ncbi:unnamed protein product [Boreogadus saida]